MWQFFVDGGPVMFLLLVTSFVSVAFIIERGLALRWRKVVPPEVEQVIEACRQAGQVETVKRVCEQVTSPLSRLLLTGIKHLDWPKEENVNALETRARHEVIKLERGLVVLEIIVGISPLIGLVGAIHGLIVLFGDLGEKGVNDNAIVAKGIAIALHTTLVGLLVAIPTLIAWSYYTKKVEILTVEIENICDDFLRGQYQLTEGAETGEPVRTGTAPPGPTIN
jgi:biopolymer transport protein ExbB